MKKYLYPILVLLLFLACNKKEDDYLELDDFGFQEGEITITLNGTTHSGITLNNETYTFTWINNYSYSNSFDLHEDGKYAYFDIDRYESPVIYDQTRNIVHFEFSLNQDPESVYYNTLSGFTYVDINKVIDNTNMLDYNAQIQFRRTDDFFSEFYFNNDTYELKAKGQYIGSSSEADPITVTFEIDIQLYKIIKNTSIK